MMINNDLRAIQMDTCKKHSITFTTDEKLVCIKCGKIFGVPVCDRPGCHKKIPIARLRHYVKTCSERCTRTWAVARNKERKEWRNFLFYPCSRDSKKKIHGPKCDIEECKNEVHIFRWMKGGLPSLTCDDHHARIRRKRLRTFMRGTKTVAPVTYKLLLNFKNKTILILPWISAYII